MTTRDPALRQAIELALTVAREGEQHDPPVPAPPRLRPYLAFARMPPAALEVARRVVEDDEAFRRRVAEVATESSVGHTGWLWLARPPGWDEALAARSAEVANGSAQREAASEDQHAARRLAAATEAAARAEAQRREAERQVLRQREQLAEARRQRRELQAVLDGAHAEIARLTEERTAAVRQLKSAEAQLAERGAEARELRREVRDLRAEVEELRARLAASEQDEADQAAAPATAGQGGDGRRAEAEPLLDRTGLARAVAAASAAAAELSRALGSASAYLDVPPAGGARRSAGHPGAGGRNGRPGGAAPRRRPLRMPPGVFDDTGEAVDFLCRADRVLFLVDGYNVSKTAWADHDLVNQRRRLVDGLANLHAKTGAQVEVVFDGVDDGSLGARAMPGPVRVRFTPAGHEADDMILELIDAHVADQPIVVVSSDKRVRDGARQRGANTLSSELFLPVLR